jgi:CPA2 family monovalent cation:H+ antiporter-2
MTTSPAFIRDLAYVFLAAVGGSLLAWRLRQPLIIGYVLAGILISPFTPGPSVSDVRTLEVFAEFGVILLMFSVGLEFSVRDLLRAGRVALLGGPLGILLLIGMGIGAGHVLGWPIAQGFVVGAIVCVASTMVLTRLLLDQGLLHTPTGRIMVTITLIEDLAVIVLIAVIPGVGKFEASRLWGVGQELARALVILVPAVLVGTKIIPPLLKRVARTQNRELFFGIVLAICLCTAALTQAVGLSIALGAFVAGLIISESDYAHEALAQLFHLRDAFVALFFVTIGLLIDPRMIFSNLPILGTIFALIVFGKLAVWTGVVRLFGHPSWMALTVAVGLTQIGELSFVLVMVAHNAGIVGRDVYNATLAASLVTILLNAALVRSVPPWLARRRLARQAAASSRVPMGSEGLRDHVVLCGFGRVGSTIGTALEVFGVPLVVIEIDPDICAELRNRRIPCIFGDPAHPHILKQAAAERASVVVLTLPDPDRARLAILNARRLNPKVVIVARVHRRTDREVLAQAGATEIIQPELEASATMIRHAFAYLKLPDDQVRAYLRGLREAMETLEGKPAPANLPLPQVRQLTLANPSFAGHSLRDLQIRDRFGVTVVSLTKASGKDLLNPPADTVLQLGDKLRVLGLPEEIDSFAAQASVAGSEAV